MWVFTSAKRSMGRIGTSFALLRAKLHCDKDNGRRGEMLGWHVFESVERLKCECVLDTVPLSSAASVPSESISPGPS